MTDEKKNLTTIDALIQRKQPFAVYRVPGERFPRLLTEDTGAVRLIYDLKELNGQRGFVIAPFCVEKSCPIVLIQSDKTGQPLPVETDTDEEEELNLQTYPKESFLTLCSEKYATCFHTFIEALRIRSFLLQPFFVLPVNAIFILIFICVTLLRLAFGWEVLLKSYCRAKKMNGTQSPWQEPNLCWMVNCRKSGMIKTVRSKIM